MATLEREIAKDLVDVLDKYVDMKIEVETSIGQNPEGRKCIQEAKDHMIEILTIILEGNNGSIHRDTELLRESLDDEIVP